MSRAFSHAIVRAPCRAIARALTTAGLGRPDYLRAQRQHAAYVAALRRCGVDVIVLPPLEDFPDSAFVEDVALLTGRCAILTRPGAPTRRGEVTEMAGTLQDYFPELERIEPPGTVDGGDILEIDARYCVGLTERTNGDGARQAIAVLRRNGLDGETVAVDSALHLKTCVTYLDGGVALAWAALCDHRSLLGLDVIEVPKSEAYAANSLWVNGTVLVPAGHPRTARSVRDAGFPVIELEMSEFRKADGGLSCLSLRFTPPG